jgi:hypothetical protein
LPYGSALIELYQSPYPALQPIQHCVRPSRSRAALSRSLAIRAGVTSNPEAASAVVRRGARPRQRAVPSGSARDPSRSHHASPSHSGRGSPALGAKAQRRAHAGFTPEGRRDAKRESAAARGASRLWGAHSEPSDSDQHVAADSRSIHGRGHRLSVTLEGAHASRRTENVSPLAQLRNSTRPRPRFTAPGRAHARASQPRLRRAFHLRGSASLQTDSNQLPTLDSTSDQTRAHPRMKREAARVPSRSRSDAIGVQTEWRCRSTFGVGSHPPAVHAEVHARFALGEVGGELQRRSTPRQPRQPRPVQPRFTSASNPSRAESPPRFGRTPRSSVQRRVAHSSLPPR